MGAPLTVALIGAGVMGRNHARVIKDSTRARLKVVIDPDLSRAWGLAQQVGCSATADVEAALKCDAVVIASSTETHAGLALPLLAAGRPVLVEKPLALDPDDVRKVTAQAEAYGTPLACGFVERFNSVVPAALSLMAAPALHVVSVRHSPRDPRAVTSVVHDLLIHDIDLTLRFVGATSAPIVTGAAHVPAGEQVPAASDCVLAFDSGVIAALSASRTSQRKVRQIWVETADALLELDLLRQDLAVYRHVAHQQLDGGLMTYRAETMVDIPFIRHGGEPLALQFEHFLALADGRGDPAEELRSITGPHDVAAALERQAHVVSTARPTAEGS